MTQSTKGYILAAMAAVSYGTNPIFALPLYHDGMDVTSVLLLRYALAVAILFAVMAIKWIRQAHQLQLVGLPEQEQ